MPDAKDDAKLTGDTRPAPQDGGARRPQGQPGSGRAQDDAGATSMPRELEDEAQPGKGENQAGFLKDRDGDLSGKA